MSKKGNVVAGKHEVRKSMQCMLCEGASELLSNKDRNEEHYVKD